MVVEASVEANGLVEGSALVGLALVVAAGRAQRNLGTAADGAAGEGVANAAAALDECSGRGSEVEEGKAGDGEESVWLHLEVVLQEGRAYWCCGSGGRLGLRVVGGGGKVGWIRGRERVSSESGDCTDVTASRFFTSPWAMVERRNVFNGLRATYLVVHE